MAFDTYELLVRAYCWIMIIVFFIYILDIVISIAFLKGNYIINNWYARLNSRLGVNKSIVVKTLVCIGIVYISYSPSRIKAAAPGMIAICYITSVIVFTCKFYYAKRKKRNS